MAKMVKCFSFILVVLVSLMAFQSGQTTVVGVTPDSCGTPSISLQTPTINGLSVSVNGVTQPGSSGCGITSISWGWGDGTSSTSWFPALHVYSSPGSYTITATTYQSDGQTATVSTTISISLQTITTTSTVAGPAAIPGFPTESILIGILLGLCLLEVITRKKKA
jgi:hypothetical protein